MTNLSKHCKCMGITNTFIFRRNKVIFSKNLEKFKIYFFFWLGKKYFSQNVYHCFSEKRFLWVKIVEHNYFYGKNKFFQKLSGKNENYPSLWEKLSLTCVHQ